MSRNRVGAALVVVSMVGAGIFWGVRSPKPGASTRKARKLVAALRAMPSSPLRSESEQQGDLRELQQALAPGRVPAADRTRSRVTLPERSTEPLRLEELRTGMAIDVQVRNVSDVAAQTGDGYYVYPHAHASGGTLLHRVTDDGVEDFVSFETRPAVPEVVYDLALENGVSGLRLVEGTLEMLDDEGTPRLRAAPPFIVGADGARTEATLAVEGCAVDNDPAAPWGRGVTDPGADSCTLRVRWPDEQVKYPAILDPRWTTTGSMTTPRQGHTATLLSTGNVLVVGGTSNGTTALASAELYNQSTGTWALTASMTGARTLHTATQLKTNSNSTTSGKVLIAGGLNGSTSQNTAQLYSPTTGTWTAAANLNAARHADTATLLADGRVLVAGGLNGTTTLATAALYNPASGTGTWTATTGPIPPAGLKNHVAVLLTTTNNQLSNKVLLVGGNNGTSTIASVFLFDPTQSAFSTLTALSSPREGHTATVLTNGNILITGGKNGSTVLATTMVFNPSSGMGTWTSAGTMTTARQLHAAVLLPSGIVANGQVLLAGGNNGTSTLGTAELWNGTSTWTATSALLAPVQGETATVLSNNMVLIAGGVNGSTTVAAAELYDASFALACTSNSQCATGFCANGVCCDTACNGGCGVCNLAGKVGTCSAASSTTVCRAQNGACDVAETCSGTSLSCPADAVAVLGTVCRGQNGVCDVPETCNGTTKTCPADGFAPTTTVCRASTSTCDAAETCTGTSATCPADTFAPATTVCRPAAGGCDAAETCTGTSSICPPDGLAATGTVCRPAESLCDVAESCTGTSAACPTDTFAAAGTTCGAGSPAPVCSGSAGTCPESGATSDILGFEALADWTFASGATASIVGLNPSRTQGESSFEVTAQNSARLNSAPMSSIGTVGTTVLLDITLPTSQANPSSLGDVQMYVNSPSLGISNVSLGDVGLTGLALGTWQTLAFQMPAATVTTIAQGVYSDLTFSIVLNVASTETGHYLLDNVRSVPDVVPSLLGIAQDGSTLKAIFDYQTTSSTPVNIPYGTANGLKNQTGLIASPTEVPPTTFVSTTHAPFVATLSGSLLTWTVGSHSATATPSSNQLPVTNNGDGTHDATTPDGRKINIDSTPPPSPAPATGPPVAAPFNGVLGGHLSIGPSGAATYTVPISVSPGVAGMAPNLALVYNSQGGDGIAGQGWSLTGLSRITRCPRTRQQDGYGRPVMLDSLTPTTNPDGLSDGICLDGEKLFETSPGSGNYLSESQDFTAITFDKTAGAFHIVTKAGETRYYNTTATPIGAGTAVWLLSRVVDMWGNYFDIHYNNDQGNGLPDDLNSFAASGVWISTINYSGSLTTPACNVASPPASCTPNIVTFQYECRPDTRWTRYNTFSIPQTQRLKSITTPQGTYSLAYADSEIQIPGQACSLGVNPERSGLSELQAINYCPGTGTGTTCAQPMQPLTFGWQTTRPPQPPPPTGYAIPPFVASERALSGTQFVDLNGDGRADFVLARTNGSNGKNVPQVATVLNTGNGWGAQLTGPTQQFPAYLADASDNPTGVRFADLDGDGMLDVIIDSANVMCTTTTVEGQGQTSVCLSCPVGVAPGSPGCIGSTHYGPAVWLNKFNLDGSGGWQFAPGYSYSGGPVTFTGTNPTMLGDLDGDGKADLIRVDQSQTEDANGITTTTTTITTLLNTNGAFVPQSTIYTNYPSFTFNSPRPIFEVRDINRDGLTDLVRDDYFGYPDGTIASSENVLMNKGVAANKVTFAQIPPTVIPGGGTEIDVTQRPPHFADIDGDAFYDLVDYASTNTQPGFFEGVGFGQGTGFGFGVSPGGAGLYSNVLAAFSPPLSQDPLVDGGVPQDFGYALVDIDGDGMVDLVRNHWQRPLGSIEPVPPLGGGEVLLNNGRTWRSEMGNTKWQVDASGAGRIPFEIPSEASAGAGSAFLDLDGDGMTDLVQEEVGDSGLQPGVWFNPNVRPIITTFPNGLAQPSTVTYVSITSAAGAATYKDDDGTTDANTKTFAVPMNVVSNMTAEDGTGTGALDTTTYTYHSLRQDSFGRGPLGFHRVETFDQASQVRTVTTYAQAYPYTGMPTEVDKYQVVGSQSHLTNKTTTSYCDTLVSPAPAGLGCGAVQPGPIPPGTITFVHPLTVVDVAYLHPESDDLTNQIFTNTLYEFDVLGNPTFVDVRVTKIEGGVEESFDKTTRNTYSTLEELLEGKADSTVVSNTGGTNSTTHTTTFEYAPGSTFGGVSSLLALTKKHVEPGAGWPIQVDTAYLYDQFGNPTTTTSCASDFGSCSPGATNPSGTSDPVHHPPFRTTSVSFDPSLLGTPVSYGIGRFPTKTTNALGQTETTIYDPILGKVLTKIGPSGIKTCSAYDALGRLTSQTDRCGSATPLVTNTQYFMTLPRVEICLNGPPCPVVGFSPPNSVVVTMVSPPTGATTWAYSDDQGKTTGTLAYAFDGGFLEKTTAYNPLGQVTQVAGPFELASFSDQTTHPVSTTTYDSFNRLQSTTIPLGVIDSSGALKSTTTTITYNGSTVETDRVVNGQTQTRLETKNSIGKVASETTVTETGPSTITYAYDADGNLRLTSDPVGNQFLVNYDARGRKSSTVDPDLGTWGYVEDGFGDLVGQTDAKTQTMTMTYDALGRMLTKTDSTGTAQWVWDTAPGGGIGKLAAMISAPDSNLAGPCTIPFVTATDGNRAGKSYKYTAFGDVQEVDECADGSSFVTTFQYDAFTRQSQVRYPVVGTSQLAVGYHYTGQGYLQYLTDDSTDYSVLWQSKAMNPLGEVIDEQMRNGVETQATRNPQTGWLLASMATAHANNNEVIQNWTYGFDETGNLLGRTRTDAVNVVTSSETFGYDLTNRLTSSLVTTSGGYSHPESYAYDAIGNITQKAGNAYAYGTGCLAGETRSAGPHAVCSVAGSAFTYDDNGNITHNSNRSFGYNSTNKVTGIQSDQAGGPNVSFMYGADNNRVVQAVTKGGKTSRTVYVGLGGTGKSLSEQTTTPGAPSQIVNFIYAGASHGGNALAVRVMTDGGVVTGNRYYSFDHLGSITAMSDEQGHVAATETSSLAATALGYDAWGLRRNPDGTAATDPMSFDLPVGNRQFTGQEQIPDFDLVNMNGRVYDPTLGRFLTPDPNIQFTSDLQSYNRYAYAGNNPLRYTDPTGFFWDQIGSFFKNTFSNPITDIEIGLSLAVCIGSSGAECFTFGMLLAAENAGIALGNGASFEQTVLNTAIGVGIGIATFELGPALGLNTWQSFIFGAASSALSTMLANVASGRSPLGYDVLGAVLLTTAEGAVQLGIQKVIAVSQASAQAQNGTTGTGAGTQPQNGSFLSVKGQLQDELDLATEMEVQGDPEGAQALRQEVVNQAAQSLGLVMPDGWTIKYVGSATDDGNVAETDAETAEIHVGTDGIRDASWLGSSLIHEYVHVEQILGGDYNMFGLPGRYYDTNYNFQANELPAFRAELAAAAITGISPSEILEIQVDLAAAQTKVYYDTNYEHGFIKGAPTF